MLPALCILLCYTADTCLPFVQCCFSCSTSLTPPSFSIISPFNPILVSVLTHLFYCVLNFHHHLFLTIIPSSHMSSTNIHPLRAPLSKFSLSFSHRIYLLHLPSSPSFYFLLSSFFSPSLSYCLPPLSIFCLVHCLLLPLYSHPSSLLF